MQYSSKSMKNKKFDITKYMVYIIFVAAIIIFGIWLGGTFFSVTNILNIVRQTAMISIMAVGMTFVIATGGIDLTVSGIVPMAGLLAAIILQHTGNLFLAVLAPILLGAAVGSANGILITSLSIPPFLVTLGMQGIFKGMAMWISNTKSMPIYDSTFCTVFGFGSIGPIPILLIWTIVFMLIGYYMLNHCTYGRKVLAIGGNSQAAQYSGIKVNRVIISTYMLSAMLAAVAGLLYAGRTKSAKYTYGENDEMTIIAAVVLGGTAMSGGTGSVIGAIVGSLLMGMINNGLVMGGLTVSQQQMVRGFIIIFAVAISNLGNKKKKV